MGFCENADKKDSKCVCVCVCVCGVCACVCVFKVPKNSGISHVNIALIWLKTVKKKLSEREK